MKRFYQICLFCVATIFNYNVLAQAPVIVQHPFSGEKCVGNSVSLTIVASGEGPLHYQWYLEGNLVGTDSPSYSIASVSLTDAGIYYCAVSNGSGSANSNDAQLIVAAAAPLINSYTADQDLCEGETLSLSVDAVADFSLYAWYLEGSVGVVHYGQTYNETATVATISGNYYCVVSNVCGSENTGMIDVSITDLPYFITLPQGVQICEGNDVSFTVVAGGSNLQYKWLADGTEIIGETTSTLLIENIAYPHNILYTSVVYNSCAEIIGEDVGILVIANPLITGQPLSQGDCGSEEITLYTTAFSNSDLSYQWYYNAALLDGETASSLEISTEAGIIDEYYCVITNMCSSVTTNIATITGFEAPYFTMQPHDSITCAGMDAKFECKANGEEPITYQWLFNDAIVPFGNVTGIDYNTLQFNEVFTGEQGVYTCFAYNECGSALTEEALLTVNTAPEIVMQPEDQIVCEGTSHNFELSAQGTDPIIYDWVFQESGLTVGSTSTLAITDISVANAGHYFCNMENVCGALSSNTVALTVNTTPIVVLQPDDMMVCEGDSIGFIIEATGTEPINYLWYRNNSAETWATNDTLIFNPVQFGNTGTYFCRMINECGTTDSDPFFFHVGTPPAIEWHSGNQYLCENDTLRIEVDPAGENLMFEWTHNDEIIVGATDSILLIPWIDPEYAGEYLCRIYNACSEIFTDTIVVSINPAPTVDLGGDVEACTGTPVSLHPQGDYTSYNWNNGAGTAAWFDVIESGTYFVRVLGPNGCANYDTVEVMLHPVVPVNLGSDIAICGQTNLNGPTGAYSYLWSNGSIEESITVSESGNYWLRTTGSAYGCEASDTISMIIYEIPNINLGPDHIIAADSSISIGVDALYSDYIWYNGFNGPILTTNGSMLGLGTHTIWLRVITENNCADTDTVLITVVPAQAIGSETAAEKICIYPNPARSQFFINPNATGSGNCIVSFIDLQGKTIYVSEEPYGEDVKWTFDASVLSKGIYFIEMKFDTGICVTKKMSIQ